VVPKVYKHRRGSSPDIGEGKTHDGQRDALVYDHFNLLGSWRGQA
jgi:hypothetical protein